MGSLLAFVSLLFLLGVLSFLRRLDGPSRSAEVSTTVSGKGGFLDGDLSFLRRLDEPGRSADGSTTVSGKGRFLDEDSTLLDSGRRVEECFFFCLDFALEEKIRSISDMVAREKLYCHDYVTSDVTTGEGWFCSLTK